MPITEMIREVASSHPHRAALVGDDGPITYRDLVVNSVPHARAVQSLIADLPVADFTIPDAIGNIPVIALSLEDAAHSAMLMSMLAGYRYVSCILDPRWPVEHRVRSVTHSGARLVITDDRDLHEALADWPGRVLTLETYAAEAARHTTPGPYRVPLIQSPEEPFLLIFTSGTTDLPKGFLRTRKSWAYNVEISKQYLRARPAQINFAPGPLAYSLTLYALIEVLGTGGTLHLQSRFDPISATRLIDEQRIERLIAVPAVLPAIAAQAKRQGSALPTLTDVIVGGANLSQALRDGFTSVVPNAEILSYYGAAEIGFIGYSLGGDGASLEPFGGLDLSVRDENGTEMPEGDIGTLFVRVRSQGDRYISTTGGALITHPDGWSTVNDQARLVGGNIFLEGRAGDIANTGGHKVSVVQVERALEAVPGCEVCCVVTQPHDKLGEILVAVIETPVIQLPASEGAVPAKSAILEALGNTLPPQFVPHRFYTAERLPKTVGGKIRRVEVREELESGRYTRL